MLSSSFLSSEYVIVKLLFMVLFLASIKLTKCSAASLTRLSNLELISFGLTSRANSSRASNSVCDIFFFFY